MTDTTLHTLATMARANKFTLARSGDSYLLADRWGEWRTVDGSALLTSRQAREVIETDRLRRGTQKERNRASMKFLNADCIICGKALGDDRSIKRGIGSECWERVLLTAEEHLENEND